MTAATDRPPPATVALGLGTNLGERHHNLVAARAALSQAITLTAVSRLYETAPWGVTTQPPFLNAVVLGTTTLTPTALLATLKQLEQQLGRVPGARWGPRLIDLDILLYGDVLIETPALTLPHRHLAVRGFVLAPLAELVPTWRHPQLGQSIAELLAQVDRTGLRLADQQWPV